jgi:hypothetical protein
MASVFGAALAGHGGSYIAHSTGQLRGDHALLREDAEHQLEALLTYGQTPAWDQMPAADRDHNAYLTFDGQVLMADDAPTDQRYEPMREFMLDGVVRRRRPRAAR